MPSSSISSLPNWVRTGRVWWRRRSTAARRCCSTTAGPAHVRIWPSSGCSTRARSTPTGSGSPSGSKAPDTSSAPRPPGGRARRWPRAATSTPRCTAARPPVRRTRARAATADEVAVVTGASKGSIAASVVAQLLDGGATVIATTSKLDDDRLAFYRTLYRDNARFGATAVGGARQHGVLHRHRRARVMGGYRADAKALGRSPFTSRMR